MVLTRALNQAARITSIKTIGIVQLSAISANKPQTINYYFTEATKTALFEIIYFCITGQGKGMYGVFECASETDGDLIQLTNTN